MNRPICIVGTGQLGTINAIGFAELGYDVVGYDVNGKRIAGLKRGILPYLEAHAAELLKKHLRLGRLRFTTDHADAVRGAGVIVICVADVSDLRACVEALTTSDLSECRAIAVRSAVAPGTTAELNAVVGKSASVVYSPEFLRAGTALVDFLAPGRTIVGGDDLDAAVAYAALFESLDAPVMLTTARNAELIKVAATAYQAMHVTFANKIGRLCEAHGADADDVLRGAAAVTAVHRTSLDAEHPLSPELANVI